MTALDPTMLPAPQPAVPADRAEGADRAAPAALSAPPESKGELLARVLNVLELEGVPYCITHAYGDFPARVESDVDCVMPRPMLPRRLAEILWRNEPLLGARVVQWFEERAHVVVLQGADDGGNGEVMLQLHISGDFEVADRVIFSGEQILRTRRSRDGRFWVPAAHVEFACVLANRIEKGSLLPEHTRQLSALWSADPLRCSEELERMFGPEGVSIVGGAALRNDWGHVQEILRPLRREMMWRLALAQPLSFPWRIAARQLRRARRWTSRPRGGLHVVFLGPDGAGKSTVIDAVMARIAPAFLRVNYQTFARGILPNVVKKSPHALPPRGLAASLIKAAWWLVCYTLGYYKAVYPTLARGGLVLNHRYLLDAIVDPRRYRYGGPMGLLHAIWAAARKPDLVIVLDAPAEVIYSRKKETTLAETARQRDGYVALAHSLPNGYIVDTTVSPEKTINDVMKILFRHMSQSVARRMRLKLR